MSQLIREATADRCCMIICALLLTNKLLKREHVATRLNLSL